MRIVKSPRLPVSPRLPECRRRRRPAALLNRHAFRAVFAMNGENTGSTLTEAHFGHVIRLRLRSVIPMISENFFLHPLQRNS